MDLLISEANRLSGQKLELCYHCHKCTAGCPIVDEMTYGPDQLLRMVMLDRRDEVFRSRDIWLCAGCFICSTRCPNGIDLASVMDALRQTAIAHGYPAGEPDALLFHRLFLSSVRLFGRSHEAMTLGLFKLLSHVPLFNDVGAGIRLLGAGKVPLLPKRLPGTAAVRQIFKRSG